MRRGFASVLLALAGCLEPSGGSDLPIDAGQATAGPDASGQDAAGAPDAGLGAADAAGVDAGDAGPGLCGLEVAGPRWLAYSSRRSGNYDLYLVRADGTCDRQLTSDPADDLYTSWAPSGRVLAYASARGKLGIYLLDLQAGTESQLQVGDLQATSPAFSPDGMTIAFEGRSAGKAGSEIYSVSAQGGVPVKLTDNAAIDAGPVWSADGSALYFVSNRGGTYEIWSMGATGAGPKALTNGAKILGRPAAAPDGATLVFARLSAKNQSELATLTLADGKVNLLSSEEESEPSWEPGGGRIAVSSWRYGNPEIVLLDMPGGSSPVRVTNRTSTDGSPAFRP
ncbi:MAG: PD40 domain-containing protein [Deltaproteobacteria bacterium]|nr:PD40 domain-containing protein [Deltaproteobacteria bacterium]